VSGRPGRVLVDDHDGNNILKCHVLTERVLARAGPDVHPGEVVQAERDLILVVG